MSCRAKTLSDAQEAAIYRTTGSIYFLSELVLCWGAANMLTKALLRRSTEDLPRTLELHDLDSRPFIITKRATGSCTIDMFCELFAKSSVICSAKFC